MVSLWMWEKDIWFLCSFSGGLSLHLNHLIASHVTNYKWPFGTLPFGLFWSNLDTKDLKTYPRTYSGHFWNMSLSGNSRAVWVHFRKWMVSENQSFLDEGAIVWPLISLVLGGEVPRLNHGPIFISNKKVFQSNACGHYKLHSEQVWTCSGGGGWGPMQWSPIWTSWNMSGG